MSEPLDTPESSDVNSRPSKQAQAFRETSESERVSTDEPNRLRDRLVARVQRMGTIRRNTEISLVSIEVTDVRSRESADALPPRSAEYRWAVMQENMRGVTVRGRTSYSRGSLLPTDPEPFTIPEERRPGSGSTNLASLKNFHEYQLPDATWEWVSPRWMIQMTDARGSHDGYEYNWWFRKRGWRPYPGMMNAGGWVRRRTWIRLMHKKTEDDTLKRQPEPRTPPADTVDVESAETWEEVQSLIRQSATDGEKIALCRQWIARDKHPEEGRHVLLMSNHLPTLIDSLTYPASVATLLQNLKVKSQHQSDEHKDFLESPVKSPVE